MKWVILIIALCIATIAYSADLPNTGTYNPLSKYMKRAQENQLVNANDRGRTRKASTNKKPWIGDSLQDMEEIVYPVPVPWTPPPDRPFKPFPEWEEPPPGPDGPCPYLCYAVYSSNPFGAVAPSELPYINAMGSGIGGSYYYASGVSTVYEGYLSNTPCPDRPVRVFANLWNWLLDSVYVSGDGISVWRVRDTDFLFRVFATESGGTACIIAIAKSERFRKTCDLEMCFKIPIIEETCDSGATITGCPTTAVAVDSTTALGTSVEGDYTWSVTGGGSMSGSTYTAPSSNADCTNSGVVSLSCDGVVIDTCTIAVSDYPGADTAYSESAPLGYACFLPWVIHGVTVLCTSDDDCGIACSIEVYRYTTYDCEDNIVDEDEDCAMNDATRACGVIQPGLTDLRTEYLKTNGCCPAGLK